MLADVAVGPVNHESGRHRGSLGPPVALEAARVRGGPSIVHTAPSPDAAQFNTDAMNWSQRPAYTSLELFLVCERGNVITPPAPPPDGVVAGGGLRVARDCRRRWTAPRARKTTLVPVDGGDGLGMALRKVTFFMVAATAGLGMARRTTYVRPFDPVFSASGL